MTQSESVCALEREAWRVKILELRPGELPVTLELEKNGVKL